MMYRTQNSGAANHTIWRYDAKLKEVMVQLGRAEEQLKDREDRFSRLEAEFKVSLSQAILDRDTAVEKYEASRTRARRLKEELGVSRSEVAQVQEEKEELEHAYAGLEERLKNESDRLRQSRSREVTRERVNVETAMIAKCNKHFANIRDYMSRRAEYERARCLEGQAAGTRKCLEELKKAGEEISQDSIDYFAEEEARYGKEAAELKVGEIPEDDLTLSPLVLSSRFVDTDMLSTIDPHGSNSGLLDAGTAISLRTPAGREDPADLPRSSEPAGADQTDKDVMDDPALLPDERVEEMGKEGAHEEEVAKEA